MTETTAGEPESIEFSTLKAGIPERIWNAMLTKYPQLSVLQIEPTAPFCSGALSKTSGHWSITPPVPLSADHLDLASTCRDHRDSSDKRTRTYRQIFFSRATPELEVPRLNEPVGSQAAYEITNEIKGLVVCACKTLSGRRLVDALTDSSLQEWLSITRWVIFIECVETTRDLSKPSRHTSYAASIKLYEVTPGQLERFRDDAIAQANQLFGLPDD